MFCCTNLFLDFSKIIPISKSLLAAMNSKIPKLKKFLVWIHYILWKYEIVIKKSRLHKCLRQCPPHNKHGQLWNWIVYQLKRPQLHAVSIGNRRIWKFHINYLRYIKNPKKSEGIYSISSWYWKKMSWILETWVDTQLYKQQCDRPEGAIITAIFILSNYFKRNKIIWILCPHFKPKSPSS